MNLDTSSEDTRLIVQIAARAVVCYRKYNIPFDQVALELDVTAVHCNGTPLRLKDWLEADEFNFMHDAIGIRNNIDRKTGQLTGHFLPRFAK